MNECIECGDTHVSRLHCPKCGACDFGPDLATPCWNCGFAVQR